MNSLVTRFRALKYWFRTYSLRHRVSMMAEWLEKPRNARYAKLSLRLLTVALAGMLGFLSRDIISAFRAEFSSPMSVVTTISKATMPATFRPHLASESAIVGYFSLLILLIAFLVAFARIVYLAVKNSRLLGLPSSNLRRPTSEVAKKLFREAESGEDYYAAGGAIEIGRHPHIYTDLSISGWDVSQMGHSQLLIEHDLGMSAQYDDALIERIPAPSGNDGKKFALIATPTDYIDSVEKVALQVRSTSFFQISKFLRLIHNDPGLKERLTSIHPEEHKVPNSLCLHYVVQLADGNLLCLIRRPNTAYASGSVSLSGEEQLAQADIDAGPDSAAVHWFRRAICEEIFPVRVDKEGGLQEAWSKIEEFVISTRILSVLYEHYCANYALVGFVRLNLDLYWFKVRYATLRRRNIAGRDKEGTLCVMPKTELIRYCETGACELFPIWGEKRIQVSDQGESYRMHPTSRYRALMIATATGAIASSGNQAKARKFDFSKHSIMENKIHELEATLAAHREGEKRSLNNRQTRGRS